MMMMKMMNEESQWGEVSHPKQSQSILYVTKRSVFKHLLKEWSQLVHCWGQPVLSIGVNIGK